MGKIRVCVQIEGIVQGVGFRPFVYGLARRNDLKGWVLNDEKGVQIEVEGEKERVAGFLSELSSPPPLALIEGTTVNYLPPVGYQDFGIRGSMGGEERFALISPDIATCEDCLEELFDPKDRRFRYPFINCTNCGPRFTIIEDIPYDRDKTTMAPFKMCLLCSREYHNPSNRRFHAQPNACPGCGPRVGLFDNSGREVSTSYPIGEALKLLIEGKIVATKGLGGFHLACDATREDVVARLRGRKYREDKPFALMCRDLEVIERLCLLDGASRELLESKERPVVILQRRAGAKVAPSVAPGQRTLGVMLPYTPLHHLLFADGLDVLVMTSGNVSDEPIAYKDAEAFARLRGITDFFVVHNREIHTRCDDSVVKPFRGRVTFVRRARGYVPFPIRLKERGKSVLACGAGLKNTFCLTKGNYAFLSHHIGDLENFETLRSFEEGIGHFKRLFQIEPEAVAHDLHPDYLSTRYAMGLEVPRIGVQHHFAHALSCMAENGLEGPVLAVVMDGTGYGEDGAVWGGEFLEVMVRGYRRLGHLRYIPLPGGEMAVREPWRMAAVYLHRVYGGLEGLNIPFVKGLDLKKWSFLRGAVKADINSPPCSSVGRLFDAVSALLGVRETINYEGQAAVELEQMAEEGERGEYPFEIFEEEGSLIVDPDPIIAAIVEEIGKGETPYIISARFHNTMARVISRMAKRMRKLTALPEIVLSGGVFQNYLLLGRVCDLLEEDDFRVFIQQKAPTNDGGISLGQALYAICLLRG
ncbi:MAG: carbamoyltransferase HypF [Deltaproteobacteria bacterium]|nr:carbamoyltransferase HypF [Deltaproteobacteria bacterium]